MPSLRGVALSATGPMAPIEKHSSWNTPRSSKEAPLFRETPMHPSCINACLEPLKTAAHRCRLDSHPSPISQLTRFDVGYWLARPIGRRLPRPIAGLSLPMKYLIPLRPISPHSNRLTAPLPATSHSPISIILARRSRYFVSTATHSPNSSTASHGEVQSPTRSPSTRKRLSSTSTCGTTSGMSTTLGRR